MGHNHLLDNTGHWFLQYGHGHSHDNQLCNIVKHDKCYHTHSKYVGFESDDNWK